MNSSVLRFNAWTTSISLYDGEGVRSTTERPFLPGPYGEVAEEVGSSQARGNILGAVWSPLMLEQFEKQYAASAAAHSDQAGKRGDREHPSRVTPTSNQPTQEVSDKTEKPTREVTCYHCKQKRHLRRNCPRRVEAPGRFPSSSTNAVAAQHTDGDRSAYEMLRHERSLLDGIISYTLRASDSCTLAVGPTLFVDVFVEGMPVKAMVDTGSQSTIVSRAMLWEVGQHLQRMGRPKPTLERPTVHLFGKDGSGGGRELTITAQVQLSFTVDDESVNVVTFAQPALLAGHECSTLLGLSVVRRNGEVVEPNPTCLPVDDSKVSRVFRARKDVTLRPELTAKHPYQRPSV